MLTKRLALFVGLSLTAHVVAFSLPLRQEKKNVHIQWLSLDRKPQTLKIEKRANTQSGSDFSGKAYASLFDRKKMGDRVADACDPIKQKISGNASHLLLEKPRNHREKISLSKKKDNEEKHVAYRIKSISRSNSLKKEAQSIPKENQSQNRYSKRSSPKRSRAGAKSASPLKRPSLLNFLPQSGNAKGKGRMIVGAKTRKGFKGNTKKEVWLNTSDRAYLDYFQNIYRKINPLWSYPKDLELKMEQGEVIIRFTLNADGQIGDAAIYRSSGYLNFDNNVLRAVKKAAPFDPIPSGLRAPLKILAPFEFSNPLIR